MKACVVIPARYGSSRFPGKPLALINGRSLVSRVARCVEGAVPHDHIYVATDDDRIVDEVNRSGFQSVKTSSKCLTGTDRVAEASSMLDYDIVINVQGDEPLISSDDILAVLNAKLDNMDAVINAFSSIDPEMDAESYNIPKVVVSETGRLIYCSRQLIPGSMDPALRHSLEFLRQVCIYAYTPAQLKFFSSIGRKSTLEQLEDIEILRFLDFGIPVHMVKLTGSSLAVDVPSDVDLVERHLMECGHD